MLFSFNVFQKTSVTQSGADDSQVSRSNSADIDYHEEEGDGGFAVALANDEGEATAAGAGSDIAVDMVDDAPPTVIVDDEELVMTDVAENAADAAEFAPTADDADTADAADPAPTEEGAGGADLFAGEFDLGGVDFGGGHAMQAAWFADALDLFLM